MTRQMHEKYRSKGKNESSLFVDVEKTFDIEPTKIIRWAMMGSEDRSGEMVVECSRGNISR